MKRADKILIVVLMALSVLLLVPILLHSSSGSSVVVTVSNEEVLRLNLNEDGTYQVDGTQGTVDIEIKDGQVRVTQETSAHHYCSKQGFVSDSNEPIVCLPNDTVITIEDDESTEDTVIQ